MMKLPREQAGEATNRSMPSAVVIPELAYADVRTATDWLCRVFGFVERLRIGNHRAQLSFGAGWVIVVERPTDVGAPGSDVIGSSRAPVVAGNHSVMVRVFDVNQHYQHAKQAGARVGGPPVDYPYGERQYSAEDLGGHRWTFSQTIADVDPREWGGRLFT